MFPMKLKCCEIAAGHCKVAFPLYINVAGWQCSIANDFSLNLQTLELDPCVHSYDPGIVWVDADNQVDGQTLKHRDSL